MCIWNITVHWSLLLLNSLYSLRQQLHNMPSFRSLCHNKRESICFQLTKFLEYGSCSCVLHLFHSIKIMLQNWLFKKTKQTSVYKITSLWQISILFLNLPLLLPLFLLPPNSPKLYIVRVRLISSICGRALFKSSFV